MPYESDGIVSSNDEVTIENCYLMYNKLNSLFFFGKLPMGNHIKIIFDNSLKNSIGCTHINNRNGYVSPLTNEYPDDIYYVISLNIDDITDMECAMEVICHEMIHIWQWEEVDFSKYSGDYSWMNGHNKSFIAKMNTINLMAKMDYGLNLKVKLVRTD